MANCLNFGKRYEDDNRFFTEPIPFRFVELYQIGELNCEAGYCVENHRQSVFEITYVIAGKGTVVCDDHAFSIEENRVFLNIPGQTHEIRADRGTPLHFCYCGFRFISGRSDMELERFYRSWTGSSAFGDKGLLVLFLKIFRELHVQSEGYLTMVGAYVEQLVTEVYRAYREERGGKPLIGGEGRVGSAAYTAKRYIDRRYRDIDDLQKLAADLGYSYTYLAHTFKDKMGETIGSYIIGKKMEEAKWLLRTGRISVSQIAARFNYLSVQSFSNSFKKAVGLSPADFRALSAEEAEPYFRHL